MKKYDIIYSVIAHESPECVWNLYENIMKFHKGKEVLVIVNINHNLYYHLNEIPQADNLLFNAKISQKKKYTSDILMAHIWNYDVVRNYDFDLFCTLASNCLFVKNPDWEQIYTETPAFKLSPMVFSIPDTTKALWDEFLKNDHIVEVFKEKQVSPVTINCEGSYYRKDVINYIYYFCILNQIIKESFTNDVIPFEEIILPSLEKYATGHVSKRYCGLIPEINEMDLLKIIQTGGCLSLRGNHYNIVKVPRDMNNHLRKIINQL